MNIRKWAITRARHPRGDGREVEAVYKREIYHSIAALHERGCFGSSFNQYYDDDNDNGKGNSQVH